MLYGDSTFTGRTFIWDFAQSEIARRPLLGWGYQSFWLVGPDAPSVLDAPGWVKVMPNAHNGYYDTMLEMGYVGFALLVIFIIATLHAVGRVADRDPARAWLVLSLALLLFSITSLKLVDARLRIFVGGVSDCRCRNRSILAAFSADKGGVRTEDPKTGQPRAITRRAEDFAEDSHLKPALRSRPLL